MSQVLQSPLLSSGAMLGLRAPDSRDSNLLYGLRWPRNLSQFTIGACATDDVAAGVLGTCSTEETLGLDAGVIVLIIVLGSIFVVHLQSSSNYLTSLCRIVRSCFGVGHKRVWLRPPQAGAGAFFYFRSQNTASNNKQGKKKDTTDVEKISLQ